VWSGAEKFADSRRGCRTGHSALAAQFSWRLLVAGARVPLQTRGELKVARQLRECSRPSARFSPSDRSISPPNPVLNDLFFVLALIPPAGGRCLWRYRRF